MKLQNKELKGRILRELSGREEATIPGLCEMLGIQDDFVVASAMAGLEKSGEARRVGFEKIYSAEAGAAHLARYVGIANY